MIKDIMETRFGRIGRLLTNAFRSKRELEGDCYWTRLHELEEANRELWRGQTGCGDRDRRKLRALGDGPI